MNDEDVDWEFPMHPDKIIPDDAEEVEE